MTLDDAIDLLREAFDGLSIDQLQGVEEANRVIAQAVDEGIALYRQTAVAMAEVSSRVVTAPVALASVLADALITFVLRHREKPE